MSKYRVLGLFGYVALTWGGSYVAIKAGLTELPPIFFAATRLDLAAVIILPIAALGAEDWLPQSRADGLDILISGVFITGAVNGFLFVGQQYATSAVGAILFSLNPILAAGFAWVFLPGETLDAIESLGVILGIAGVGIITHPDPAALVSGSIGQLILVLAAASLAFGSVLSRRLDSSLSSLPIIGWGLLLGGILLHLASFLVSERILLIYITDDQKILLVILYLGIVATGGAYPAYFALLEHIGAIRTNLVSYAVPLVAALAGWAVLGQSITFSTIAGFAVIVVGFGLIGWETLYQTVENKISAI